MNQPTFQPTDQGFTDAVARSRRRRTRRHAATASASGTVLAVAAFAVLAGQSATPDSLQQQQPFGPAGAPTSEPLPAATPPDLAESNQAAGPQPRRSPGSASPPSPASGRQDAAESEGDVTQPRADAAPAPRTKAGEPISSPARLTTTAYEPNSPCADTTGRAVSERCMQTDPPRSGVTGQPVDLALSLCRLPGFGSAAASFPTTAEAGYALEEPGGATLWDHARQHPARPDRHDRQVQPGQCLTWTVTWTNRNDQGQPIAPGRYELRLSVLADNTGGPNTAVTQTYAYTVESAP